MQSPIAAFFERAKHRLDDWFQYRYPRYLSKYILFAMVFIVMWWLLHDGQSAPTGGQASGPTVVVDQAVTSDGSDASSVTTASSAVPEVASQPVLPKWQEVTLRRGDSLSKVFHRQHVPQKTLLVLMKDPQFKRVSRRLRAKQSIALAFDLDHHLQAMRLPISVTESLLVAWSEAGVPTIEVQAQSLAQQMVYQELTVQGSLLQSAIRQHVNVGVARQLAAIFGDRFNMRRDLRRGDQFAVLYPAYTLKGRVVKTGPVQMATLMHRGKTLHAVRYASPDHSPAYFDLQGHGLQNAFLRYPCHFKRVSSSFNLRRVHPILGVQRPHHGVDLASPRGTPIHVTADGKVLMARYQGGYGRVIKVQHGTARTTVYAHLSRYAKGLHKGQHVHRGEVIGYVGSTGFATGPHLHYEVRIQGQPKNPLTVALPKGRSLSQALMPAFETAAAALQQQWHTGQLAYAAHHALPEPVVTPALAANPSVLRFASTHAATSHPVHT